MLQHTTRYAELLKKFPKFVSEQIPQRKTGQIPQIHVANNCFIIITFSYALQILCMDECHALLRMHYCRSSNTWTNCVPLLFVPVHNTQAHWVVLQRCFRCLLWACLVKAKLRALLKVLIKTFKVIKPCVSVRAVFVIIVMTVKLVPLGLLFFKCRILLCGKFSAQTRR